MAEVFATTGGLDVSFNGITAVPQPGTQGIPIAELPVDSFIAPITLYLRSHFLTARSAARRMAEQGSGVLLMNTPEPARLGLARVGGMGPAWAAMEALNRNLSAEFGASGVRAVCIRSSGMPETGTIDIVYGLHAEAMGISREQFQAFGESLTHRKRSSRVSEVAEMAAFLASDRAKSFQRSGASSYSSRINQAPATTSARHSEPRSRNRPMNSSPSTVSTTSTAARAVPKLRKEKP